MRAFRCGWLSPGPGSGRTPSAVPGARCPGLGWWASPTRTGTKLVDWDAKRGMVKVNPIAAWTQDVVDAYIAEHQVPVNPLFEIGYGSIGCMPCTEPTAPGEDARSGRWRGRDKTECGLHVS